MSSQDPLALTLRNLSRRFGRRWALRGITLDAAAGEVIGVMGHNGSGKSTLLRVVATALRPSFGDGWVLGRHLVRDAHEVRRLVGFLAHAPGLYDDLTAWENLRFAVRMLGEPEAAIDPALERVGLARERNERVRGFSAGMQRRLALARLTLARPRLLLLDEPYNNFDPAGIRLVDDLIHDVRERGGGALVVLHDRRQGEGLLDRTIDLVRGAVAAPSAINVAGAPAVRLASAGRG